MNMMELDGLASDVDALFGISGLKEDLMDVGILGATAGVSVVAGELLFTKVPMLEKQNIFVKAAIAAALGVGGGIAAARYVNKAVGAGIGAGLLGWGVAKAIEAGVNKVKPGFYVPISGMGQVSDRDLLLGMGAVDNDVSVSDYRPIPGQTSGMEASDYRPIPGQTNGLGQAGDVYARDIEPMPGTNGRNGYMDGIAASFS